MTTITLRNVKGSALSFTEVDNNFSNLNNDKIEGITSSVDGELTLWSSTTGKVLKRANLTGIVKATSGVATTATAGTDYGAPGTAATWTASQRGTVTTANSGSFDMSVTNNFICTPAAGVTLTFTNITAGQSGYVTLVNPSAYTISKAAAVKMTSTALTTISTAGTYLLSYHSPDGTNVYVSNVPGAMS